MSEVDIHIIGCGYIGKKVASRLIKKNISHLCLVHTAESKSVCADSGLIAKQFDLDKSDLGLSKAEQKNLSGKRIAYFSPPPATGKVDTRMSHFIELLENQSITPEKILLISTTGVYGDCLGEWIDETRLLNPVADRAWRRVNAEEQLKKYCKDKKVPFHIFRVPGIYAADKLPVKRITSGEPIVNAEDSGFTNRIHAEDLAAFCVEALVSNVEPGIYNCCDGHPSTMNDYFMKVADALGKQRPDEISLQQAQKELSPGMLSYLAESKRISNKKLLTNFRTQLMFPDLDAGLRNQETMMGDINVLPNPE